MVALGTFTLVVDGTRIGGDAETTAKVTIRPQNPDGTIKDADADKFYFKASSVTAALPYTISLPTDVAAGGGDSTAIGYHVDVVTTPGARVSSDFAAKADGSTVALTDVTETVVIPVADSVAAANQAQASATAAAASASDAAASAQQAQRVAGQWAPSTAYAAGQVVLAPDGSLITRTTAGTSRATFDATEQAAWVAVSAKSGTMEQVALSAAYVGQMGGRQRSKVKTDGTDQAATLQGELNSLSTFGGGTLELPGGDVSIAAEVTVPDGVSMSGSGGGLAAATAATRIVCTTAAAGVKILGSGGHISHLTIDGNAVATRPLYRFQGTARLFSGVHVINSAGHNWTIESSQNDTYIGCQSEGAALRGLCINLGAGGLCFVRWESNSNAGGQLLVQQSATTAAPYYTTPTHIGFLHSIFERNVADVHVYEGTAGEGIEFRDCAFIGQQGATGLTASIFRLSGTAHAAIDGCRFFGYDSGPVTLELAGSAQLTVTGRNMLFTTGPDVDAPTGTRVYMGGRLDRSGGAGLTVGANTPSNGSNTIYDYRNTPEQTSRPAAADWIKRIALAADAGIRFEQRADGSMRWGDGTSFTQDTLLYRYAAALLGVTGGVRPTTDATYDLGAAAGRWRNGFFSSYVKVGATTTANRPSATAAGAGASMFDTTLGKPIWSNGTAWVDATGTAV